MITDQLESDSAPRREDAAVRGPKRVQDFCMETNFRNWCLKQGERTFQKKKNQHIKNDSQFMTRHVVCTTR